jgi:serine/threonine-protein kinase RsbT
MTHHTIRQALDIYGPRAALDTLSAKLGFRRPEQQELAIVLSELVSNIVKYGIRGSVDLDRVDDEHHGIGIVILARDVGPPFRDFGMALQDGCDDQGPIDPGVLLRRGGLGIGLGAVVRLTDDIGLTQRSDGKEIRAVRYLKRPRPRRPSRAPF